MCDVHGNLVRKAYGFGSDSGLCLRKPCGSSAFPCDRCGPCRLVHREIEHAVAQLREEQTKGRAAHGGADGAARRVAVILLDIDENKVRRQGSTLQFTAICSSHDTAAEVRGRLSLSSLAAALLARTNRSCAPARP
jgi:hypothetical protein